MALRASSKGALPYTKIADLRPYMKTLNVAFIVLEKLSSGVTREGNTITQFWIADPSASITISLWDDLGHIVKPGDILELRGG